MINNTAVPVLTEAQEDEQFFLKTGRHLIAELNLSAFIVNTAKTGIAVQWTHEATNDATGDMLFSSVSYGGWVKGVWSAALVQRLDDGTYKFNSLLKLPVIRLNTKQWSFTLAGLDYRRDGRL